MKEITVSARVLDHKKTGAAARAERVKLGHTRETFAEAMNISVMYLYELETGKKKWRPELVERFNAAVALLGSKS